MDAGWQGRYAGDEKWQEVPDYRLIDSHGNLECVPFQGTRRELVQVLEELYEHSSIMCVGERIVMTSGSMTTRIYRPLQI